MSDLLEPAKPSPARKVAADMVRMARWQKVLLTVGLAFSAVGMAGWAADAIRSKPPVQPEQTQSVPEEKRSPSTPGSGLVDTRSAPRTDSSDTSEPKPSVEEEQSWRSWASTALRRAGLSLLGGFIVGWAFRLFVKTTFFIALLCTAVLLGLSWFNVLNVDMSKAREQYDTNYEWIMDQAGKLKDATKARLPSTVFGAVGVFAGFRRKS